MKTAAPHAAASGGESGEVACQSTVPLPLIVDLDNTLIRTDSLHEILLAIAFRAPGRLPGVVAALRHGRATFKAAAAHAAALDCDALPYDRDVLQLIGERRAAGGTVHLVTAADQGIADAVAASLEIFDTATGSRAGCNLKAAAKADHIAARFPDGFDYVGDSIADMAVWRRAGSAIVAGPAPRVERRLRREHLATTVLPRRGARPRDWIKALRLHQWSKNALVFVPLILSREFGDRALLLQVAAAWLLFGLVASATYLVNDLSDLAADRQHPTKRFRALAAGRIAVSTGALLAITMLGGGLAGAFWLHSGFGGALASYAALTLLYSFRLKREPLIDVATIAALFAIRITAGMIVIGHAVSLWLVTFTTVLFLSLALAKRTAELTQAAQAGRAVKGRGYLPGDAPLTLALGIAAGTVSVVVMVLYMSIDAMTTGLYAERGPLFMIPAVLGLWIMRIWLLAHRGVLDDDPVVYAIRDRTSWGHAVAVAGLWAAAAGVIG